VFLHLQKLKRKDAEIGRLQGALGLFLKKNESQESIVDQEQDLSAHGSDEEMDVETNAEKGDQEDDMEEDEDDEPSKPLFDESTGLYFCPECMAEIDEGFCSLCGHEYEWKEASPFPWTGKVLKLKHVSTERPFSKYRVHGKPGNTPRSQSGASRKHTPLAG